MDVNRLSVTLLVLVLGFLPLMASADSTVADGSRRVLNLEEYKGRVVVLDFWASWCAPCRESFPWLNAMHMKYADKGLVIVGVNVDAERAEADAFLQKYPAQFPVVFDAEGTLATRYDIIGMPSSVVIGPDGDVISQHHGFRKKYIEKYEATFREALASIDN